LKIISCSFSSIEILIFIILYFFSHHKRAAAELVPLESNPTHGILPAEEYIPAKLSSFFSVDAYNAFDMGRNVGKKVIKEIILSFISKPQIFYILAI